MILDDAAIPFAMPACENAANDLAVTNDFALM
jgi:hypothetical protein